jgi:hypothetical protein
MRFLLAVALVACSSSSPPAPTSQVAVQAQVPPPNESPSPTTPPANTAAPGVGQPCGANGLCAAGFECVSYFGVAGARGPQFKTCEIRCGADKPCPNGLACKTIADGPGQVCR